MEVFYEGVLHTSGEGNVYHMHYIISIVHDTVHVNIGKGTTVMYYCTFPYALQTRKNN